MSIKSIEKMDGYNATEYVNNSEPDLDAENLNKTENKIKETVAKANEIIDTLNALISKTEQELAQLNSNLGDASSRLESLSSDLNTIKTNVDPVKSSRIDNIDTNILNRINLVVWGPDTASTPFKTQNTVYGNGFCITYSTGDQWLCQLAMAVGDSNIFTRHRRLGVWSGWTTIGTTSSV